MIESIKTNEKDISDIFLNAVSELAFQYDCKLLECDYDEKGKSWNISIDGLPKNQRKMERALGRVFAEWDEDRVDIPIVVAK